MGALEDFDLEEALRIAVEAHMSDIQFALPVRVLKDSDGKTVSIRPTIQATQVMPDGTTKLIDFPDLEAPVQFASGGGKTSTFPIKSEDEGIAIFSSRSFANWREAGGTQPQVDGRQNDLSDPMFIPGVRSKPRDLKNISTDSAQTRTDDHKTVSDWSDEGITHAREDAVHNTSAGGIMSALKGALLSVTGKGIAASKGGSSHVVVDGAVSSLAPKVLLNC